MWIDHLSGRQELFQDNGAISLALQTEGGTCCLTIEE